MIPDKLPDAPIRHWYSRYFFSDPPEILARAFYETDYRAGMQDRKSTRLNSSHRSQSRMPSSA